MWFDVGAGWSFRWAPDSNLYFRHLSTDADSSHHSLELIVEGSLSMDRVCFLIEQLAGKLRADSALFRKHHQPSR